LRAAESFGLRKEDYELATPAAEAARVLSGEQVAASVMDRFDAALTDSASRFLRHLHHGRVDPRAAGFDLPSKEVVFDSALAVQRLATARDVSAAIAAVEPRPPPYRLLKQALARYRTLASQTTLTTLPPLPRRSLATGDQYEGARKLRALLVALGDLERVDEPSDDPVIDESLIEGVRRFQDRHGLDVDGVIGPKTFAALVTPLRERVRQIELTLERWRWTASLERPDIVVNIPQFTLYALPPPVAADASVLEMRVVGGQNYPHTRTPVFVTQIEHVVFQPFWDVPHSIARRELLPLIRKDPAYLARHDMEIVRGASADATPIEPTPQALDEVAAGRLRVRQRPGPHNALGSVKFVAPNPYAVYLHATPHVHLFGRASRAFSHGCIRVSEPALLAEYVLKNAPGDWDLEAIQAAMCDPKTRRVNLAKPVRVLMFYGTAAATQSGVVLFFEDVYGHDDALEALLRAHE